MEKNWSVTSHDIRIYFFDCDKNRLASIQHSINSRSFWPLDHAAAPLLEKAQFNIRNKGPDLVSACVFYYFYLFIRVRWRPAFLPWAFLERWSNTRPATLAGPNCFIWRRRWDPCHSVRRPSWIVMLRIKINMSLKSGGPIKNGEGSVGHEPPAMEPFAHTCTVLINPRMAKVEKAWLTENMERLTA